jgi:hypothetical protein
MKRAMMIVFTPVLLEMSRVLPRVLFRESRPEMHLNYRERRRSGPSVQVVASTAAAGSGRKE